ncbi:MAG TPA: hypothetical protein VGL56_01635 [Fimbriimonadaceae bacterium]|jgi:hypothetical protein
MAQQQNTDSWVKGGLLGVASLAIIGGIVYLSCGREGTSVSAPPAGSVYYKGKMNADIESEAHDPRNRHKASTGQTAPANTKGSVSTKPPQPAGPKQTG